MKALLEKMYLKDHMTYQEIGKELGLTRQGVHYKMKFFGIDTSTGERFNCTCDICGKEYSITRKRYLTQVKHFCSSNCRVTYLKNREYKQWRHGQRIARMVMSKNLDRMLREGEVVHHIDSDNTNNEFDNLMLFKSNSEHLAFHHKLKREKCQIHPNL